MTRSRHPTREYRIFKVNIITQTDVIFTQIGYDAAKFKLI